jgi:hypothetical protein
LRKLFGRGEHKVVVDRKRQDAHVGRSDRGRPLDAIFVVVLFDHGGHAARDADAVAAHDEGALLAVFVAEGGAHGLGVLVAQLEDLAHFDAARERDRLAAFGAGVARLGGAQVGPEIDGEIAALFGAHVVVAVLVGAYDPVLDALQALVGADAHAFGQAHAANRALGQAGSLDLFVGEQLEAFHRAADLDLVELVVARHEDGDDGAFGVLAHHGLDRGGFGDVQELGELGNRVHAGGLDLAQGGFVVLLGVRQAGGDFGVGRPAAGAAGEFGFAASASAWYSIVALPPI